MKVGPKADIGAKADIGDLFNYFVQIDDARFEEVWNMKDGDVTEKAYEHEARELIKVLRLQGQQALDADEGDVMHGRYGEIQDRIHQLQAQTAALQAASGEDWLHMDTIGWKKEPKRTPKDSTGGRWRRLGTSWWTRLARCLRSPSEDTTSGEYFPPSPH